jgi:hypothetical protein
VPEHGGVVLAKLLGRMTGIEHCDAVNRAADHSPPSMANDWAGSFAAAPATLRISAGGRHALALVRRRPADRYAMRTCPMQYGNPSTGSFPQKQKSSAPGLLIGQRHFP